MTLSAARALPQHPAAVRVPLFQSLVDRMEAGGRWVVMDLGRAKSETIALFGEFRCRLEIVDLIDELDLLVLDDEADPGTLVERAESLLPEPGPEPVDIVLCWDLLNYLDRPAIAALMSRLAARGKPGTVVHALIAYRDRTMAARPAGFFPLDSSHLARLNPPTDERPAPRYSPEDLALALREFTTDRGVLLGNGMQEFIFRL